MPSFLFKDAALDGFRFTRERPGAVTAWAAATFVFSMASGVLGSLVGGDALRAFQSLGGHPTIAQIFAALPPAAVPLFVTFLVNFAGAAFIYASAIRAFIGVDRPVRFKVGEDEIRLFVILLIYFVTYIVLNVIVGIIIGLIANVAAIFGDLAPDMLNFFAPAIVICVPGFFIVRLSLAPVIAVDRKRIDFRESWVSTKGHFWPLAGALLLSLVLFLIVAFVALMLVMILAELASIGTGGLIATPGQFFSPDQADHLLPSAVIFGGIIGAVFIAVFLPVVLGPQVRAYQAYDIPDIAPTPVQA